MTGYRPPSRDVRQQCEERGYSRHVREGGFDYLFHRWTKTVVAVERGYHLSFYEYLNDMDGRRITDELATYASEVEWKDVEAALPALDARFLAATLPTRICICGEQLAMERGYRSDRDWWYYRVPADLSKVNDFKRWEERVISRSSTIRAD